MLDWQKRTANDASEYAKNCVLLVWTWGPTLVGIGRSVVLLFLGGCGCTQGVQQAALSTRLSTETLDGAEVLTENPACLVFGTTGESMQKVVCEDGRTGFRLNGSDLDVVNEPLPHQPPPF